MPLWTGWNREHVLHSRTSPSGSPSDLEVAQTAPNPAGFTAINAPNARQHPSFTSGHAPTSMALLQQSVYESGFTQEDRPMTVISNYLGRSDPDGIEAPILQGTGALRGHGSKKAVGRGAKRVVLSKKSQPASKRRKISDITDGMPITKSSAKFPPSKGFEHLNSSTETDLRLEAVYDQILKLKSPRKPITHAEKLSMPDEFSDAPTQSVSVFAPSTSMTLSQQTTQQTSVDALRTSNGRGQTLYQGLQDPNEAQTSVCYTKPWLNEQISKSIINNIATNSRKLRPRKAGMPYAIDHSLVDMENGGLNKTIELVEEPQYAGKEKPTGNDKDRKAQTRKALADTLNRQLASKNKRQPEDGDFFSEDEEEIADVAELADRLEKDNSPEPRLGSAPGQQIQLVTPAPSDFPPPGLSSTLKIHKREATLILNPDEEYLTLIDDEKSELDHLSEASEDVVERRQPTPPPRERKLNMREVDEFEDYGGAFLSEAERQLLDSFKATASPDITPIVRKPFPAPILDRSPIFGAANTTLLRTCFRVGEAVNVGTQAIRSNQDVILELYARVTSSHREPNPGRKRSFTFKDLYHDNPPYLEGSFELWQQSVLWDLDSKPFLLPRQEGIMCRAIAKMKREGMKWRLELLNIWEAAWDDIDYVAGIYARAADFSDD